MNWEFQKKCPIFLSTRHAISGEHRGMSEIQASHPEAVRRVQMWSLTDKIQYFKERCQKNNLFERFSHKHYLAKKIAFHRLICNIFGQTLQPYSVTKPDRSDLGQPCRHLISATNSDFPNYLTPIFFYTFVWVSWVTHNLTVVKWSFELANG